MEFNIEEKLDEFIKSGKRIPKPETDPYKVKGWGTRRGEKALIYFIPSLKHPTKPYQKGINLDEWQQAHQRIKNGEDFSREWFNEKMSDCAKEGGCNFTTIGGVFLEWGLVEYKRGVYSPMKK